MRLARIQYSREGLILVLALWALGLLTVLAVALSAQIHQRITFLARIEARDQLKRVAEAGIFKAIAVLNQDFKLHGRQLTPPSKALRHNNPQQFYNIAVADGNCAVMYHYPDGGIDSVKNYGMMDEESKLNLNKADEKVLSALIKRVVGLKEEDAAHLAVAIVDWRKEHSSELSGFYSDDFYENLQFPYPVKDADYESLDELLLVRGMNAEIFNALKDYVTVYGDGKVNINTASRVVLLALGIDETIVDKVLSARRGPDGIEATADDFIFERPYDIASDVKAHVEVKDEDVSELDQINAKERLGTSSAYYRIESIGALRGTQSRITCIYNNNSGKIDYWKEE